MRTTALVDLRRSRLLAAALIACLMTLGLAPSAPRASEEVTRLVSVIVQSLNGAPAAADAVQDAGGVVERNLPIIDGVSAVLPVADLDTLSADDRVWQVSPNAKVGFHGTAAGETIHRIQKVVGASKLWSSGVTGQGVTVGLLDTGVYEHADLAGRVVCGADLSHEAGGPAHCADTFGHGTFMAGLIAGNGASSNGKYKGAAPQARIVSVKAAGYDGSTDVSTILDGIQWFVAHKNEYSIDVLNLSLGSDSAQDYRLSPLNYAVERAWDKGIVVVVSAGNSGPDSRTVMKPGDDPFVITVGASNDEGSVAYGDDRVPVFSSRGPTRANGLTKPDVVSPGVHTISLRSPGSAIDQKYCSTACVDSSYFRGTGTSMSTATVSGVVAQVLHRNPNLTPDQVKHRLMSTANPIADSDPNTAGAGLVDAYDAATSSSLEAANQGLEHSTGLGSISLDRGTLDLEIVTPIGQLPLVGEYIAATDPTGVSATNPAGLFPWSAVDYVSSGWDAATWKAATWKAATWKAATWKAATWKATTWDAATWKGTAWENSDWDAATWKNVDWDAATWKAATWKSAWYAVAWE